MNIDLSLWSIMLAHTITIFVHPVLVVTRLVLVPGPFCQARSGHAAVLAGRTLVVFGGEALGRARALLNDVALLDLDTWTWTMPELR